MSTKNMCKEKKEAIINYIAVSQASFSEKLATMIINSDLTGDDIQEIFEVTSLPAYQQNKILFSIKFDDQFKKNATIKLESILWGVRNGRKKLKKICQQKKREQGVVFATDDLYSMILSPLATKN